MPKVSNDTTCQLLLEAKPKPLEGIIDFYLSQDTSPAMVRKTQSMVDEVTAITASAQPEMAQQLEVVINETQGILDGTSDGDTSRFKAAGLEVTTICTKLGYEV